MNNFLRLQLTFLKFWFIDAPLEMTGFFSALNNYIMQAIALDLCIKTYFKPLKNEYRQGLVGFTIGMGIVVKTGIITADLFIFIILISLEFMVIFAFLIFPLSTLLLLFL